MVDNYGKIAFTLDRGGNYIEKFDEEFNMSNTTFILFLSLVM